MTIAANTSGTPQHSAFPRLHDAGVEGILRSAHAAWGGRLLVHRPALGPEGWGLEWFHSIGFPDEPGGGLRARLDAYLSRAPFTWAKFNALRPERDQRDVVVDHGRDWRGCHAGSSLEDASTSGTSLMRVLVCDGPQLLAYFGCFRDRPFEAREKREMASLVDPLRAELRAASGAPSSPALDAALEAIAMPVFLVSASGRVLYANETGSRLAASQDRGLLEEIGRCAHGDAASFDVTRLGSEGASSSFLAIARAGSIHALEARALAATARWGLTKRQVEVLRRLVRGDSNKDIAAKLECTVGTVELHITSILRRAGVVSRAQIVAKFWTD